MNTPTWGISSSAFLALFVVLAAASLALPRLAAARAARRGVRTPATAEDTELNAEQLACLAGGRRRAAEASVAG